MKESTDKKETTAKKQRQAGHTGTAVNTAPARQNTANGDSQQARAENATTATAKTTTKTTAEATTKKAEKATKAKGVKMIMPPTVPSVPAVPASATADPYSVRIIMEEMELELARNYAIALKSGTLTKSMAEWQILQMSEAERYKRKQKATVAKYFKKAKSAVFQTLITTYGKPYELTEEQAKEAANRAERIIKAGGKDAVAFGFFNDKKMNAMASQIAGTFDKAEQAVFRQCDDIYRQTIFQTGIKFASGSMTLTEAIDEASSKFLENGIDCITYKNGRRVNIASYAEMALRTANQRAKFLADGNYRDAHGLHLVMVSKHANTCSLCLSFQGKILVDDVYTSISVKDARKLAADNDCDLLSNAMSDGLFHPNCRHNLVTYIPGITRRPMYEIDDDKALELYNAEQKQRAIERAIRKEKRKALGAVDEKNKAKATKKVKEKQKQMRELLKAYPELRREPWRESYYLS